MQRHPADYRVKKGNSMQLTNIYTTNNTKCQPIMIDSRNCGSGKTQGHNGTISHIKKLYNAGKNCLVVLPSIKLADEYEKLINKFLDRPDELKIINSTTSEESVTSQLYDLDDNAMIVIITNQAWIRFNWEGFKSHWNLVIDEVIDPFGQETILEHRRNTLNFDWAKNTTCDVRTVEEIDDDEIPYWVFMPEYRIIKFDKFLCDNSITKGNHTLKTLGNPNQKIWLKQADHKLFTSPGKTKDIVFITELNANIVIGWQSVTIAAAMFEKSFMAAWLTANEVIWKIKEGYEFKPHETRLHIHTPIDDINWSIGKAKADHPHLKMFWDYVSSLDIKDPVLVLRNNSVKSSSSVKLMSEVRAQFNCHGSNEYKDIEHVLFEASINLTPELSNFLRKYLDPSFDLFFGRTGLDFYQILMRSCLREGKEAHVYILDTRLAAIFAGIFDVDPWKDLHQYQGSTKELEIEFQNRQKPLTQAQKQKAYRLRKKHNLSKDIESRDVLKLYT